MTDNTRFHNRFEYHVEDLDCSCCLFYIRRSKFKKNGCHEETCRFEDIRQEAVKNGRIKRKPGWFRCRV
jgi:hypothetical protein